MTGKEVVKRSRFWSGQGFKTELKRPDTVIVERRRYE
jgi:hypothetical protein